MIKRDIKKLRKLRDEISYLEKQEKKLASRLMAHMKKHKQWLKEGYAEALKRIFTSKKVVDEKKLAEVCGPHFVERFSRKVTWYSLRIVKLRGKS